MIGQPPRPRPSISSPWTLPAGFARTPGGRHACPSSSRQTVAELSRAGIDGRCARPSTPKMVSAATKHPAPAGRARFTGSGRLARLRSRGEFPRAPQCAVCAVMVRARLLSRRIGRTQKTVGQPRPRREGRGQRPAARSRKCWSGTSAGTAVLLGAQVIDLPRASCASSWRATTRRRTQIAGVPGSHHHPTSLKPIPTGQAQRGQDPEQLSPLRLLLQRCGYGRRGGEGTAQFLRSEQYGRG